MKTPASDSSTTALVSFTERRHRTGRRSRTRRALRMAVGDERRSGRDRRSGKDRRGTKVNRRDFRNLEDRPKDRLARRATNNGRRY